MDKETLSQRINDDYAFRAQCKSEGFGDPGMSKTLAAELESNG